MALLTERPDGGRPDRCIGLPVGVADQNPGRDEFRRGVPVQATYASAARMPWSTAPGFGGARGYFRSRAPGRFQWAGAKSRPTGEPFSDHTPGLCPEHENGRNRSHQESRRWRGFVHRASRPRLTRLHPAFPKPAGVLDARREISPKRLCFTRRSSCAGRIAGLGLCAPRSMSNWSRPCLPAAFRNPARPLEGNRGKRGNDHLQYAITWFGPGRGAGGDLRSEWGPESPAADFGILSTHSNHAAAAGGSPG